MTRFLPKVMAIALSLLLAIAAARSGAQPAVESELRALAQAFETAWNTHDMNVAFRKLLTDDIDWVNVDSGRGSGIKQVVDGHVRVHADKFKDSVMTIKDVDVGVIRPNVAVMHVSWGLRGDRNNDGSPREPREGMFTWVVVREAGAWKIRASHNTNRNVVK